MGVSGRCPLVSVVIPAFNAEQSIKQALDSVTAQTYRPIEIIVVDDGSTDGTSKIVNKYASGITGQADSAGVKVISLYQPNSGPSKARNRAICSAHGDFIAFLDADDVWTTDKLEKQVRFLEQNPDVDVVFTDVTVVRQRAGSTEQSRMFEKKELNEHFFGHPCRVINPLEKLLRVNFLLTPAVMARRACFRDDLRFDEGRRYAEDWELWLRMASSCNIGYVGDACVTVFNEYDGLSSHSSRMIEAEIEILEKALAKHAGEASGVERVMVERLRETCKWAGYHFMVSDDKRRARAYLKKALQMSFDAKTLAYYLRSCLP